MSEVMKALQQSEQAYQAQVSSSRLSSSGRFQTAKPTRSWLIPILILFPVVVIFTFIIYQHFDQIALVEPSQPLQDVSHIPNPSPEVTQVPLAKLLPYPELNGLQPLPKVVVKAVLPAKSKSSSVANSKENASEGRRIKTDQVDFNQPSDQGWGIDNLDLSGLSPELAQRFQSALGAQSSQNKALRQPSTIPSKPESAVNLVGHEANYRGRLPKMNFETHMYSSKPQSRWIKVNGHNIYEGEWIINKLVKLEQILPVSLIVTFDGQQIQVPALYEWDG